MENALLIGLSHQMALKRQMDVVANNLANVNTAGYKSDNLKFEEYVMPVARMSELTGRDSRLSYVLDPIVYRNFNEGSFEQTGNDLDVAIKGEGWLTVQTPTGERYTRNGQLKISAEGQLVDNSGNPVLGEGGPLTFNADETGIEIASDGTISTTAGNKGRLRLVKFDSTASLSKESETLFSSRVPGTTVENPHVVQGMVEKSNVNGTLEMTRMIETLRAYTNSTRAIEQTQQLRRDAIERLGETA